MLIRIAIRFSFLLLILVNVSRYEIIRALCEVVKVRLADETQNAETMVLSSILTEIKKVSNNKGKATASGDELNIYGSCEAR